MGVRAVRGRDPDADAGISVSATEHDEAFAGIGSRDEGFVMVGQRDGRPLLVTVKSKTPQTRLRLVSTTEQLRAAAKHYQQVHEGGKPQLLAVFPGACLRQSWVSSVTTG